MNDCYNFQNSTGLDVGDLIDRNGLVNLITESSNDNYSYSSNYGNVLNNSIFE